MFSALEKLPGLAAAAIEWRELLHDNAGSDSQFLKPAGRLVESCRCPLGCGCAHQVVPADKGLFAAVCVCDASGGCEDMELRSEDLQVHELNVPKLAREIARALECRPLFSQMPVRQTWQIGAWSAAAVPVLLTIPADPGAVRRAAAELAGRLRSRFILLCPTAAAIDAAALELLANAHSAVFTLETLLRLCPGGRLEPRGSPGTVFSSFTPEPAEPGLDVARKAFALIQQLEARSPKSPPTVSTVFRLYCIETLSAARIARQCRCSKTTVIERLQRIRKATGVDPASFRQMASHFESIEDGLSDSRAPHLYRPSADD